MAQITKTETARLIRVAQGRSYFERGRTISFRCPACEGEIVADRYGAMKVPAMVKSWLGMHLSGGDCPAHAW